VTRSQDTRYVKAATLENQIESQVVSGLLAERGIAHRIQSFQDTAYDGLFQLQKGWGALYVSETDIAEVQELLAQIRRGVPSPPAERRQS